MHLAAVLDLWLDIISLGSKLESSGFGFLVENKVTRDTICSKCSQSSY